MLIMYRKKYKRVYYQLTVALIVASPITLFSQTNRTVQPLFPDSVTVATSDVYSDPSFLRTIFMGKNYRREWKTPVTLPVLNLSALRLTVKELGGGRQTKSLRLVDKNKVEWALRTVDKDVRPAIPSIIRNKFTVSIVQDMVSAAHPFAPLTIPPLAQATGVTAASPVFYFVPDDPALGEYRDLFAGTVCLLEKRDLLPGIDLKNSEKVLQNLFDDHHSLVNQSAYLNARLLDMLIADWDRHYDQWKWAELDSGNKTVYLAIPKDRDQAYFFTQGLLLKIIRLFGMKFTVGFSDETSNIVKLNRIAWELDRLLLNELSLSKWQEIVSAFQQHLSDEQIRNAVKLLPGEVYPLHGELITQKLLDRKKTLPLDVIKYYRFLAKEVTVYGTDKAERFELKGNSDSVTLTVRNEKDNSKIYYQRTFYPAETKKITLIGLDGDDVFVSDDNLKTKIKFDIDGGPGKNEYHIGDGVKVKSKDSDMDAKAYMIKLQKPLRIREPKEKEKNE